MLVICSSWVTDCCKSQVLRALGKRRICLLYIHPGSPPTPCQTDRHFLLSLSLSFGSVEGVRDAWELRTSPESSELIIRRFKASWMDRSAYATFNCSFPPVHVGLEGRPDFLLRERVWGNLIFWGERGRDGVDCVCRCCVFVRQQCVDPPVSDW